VFSNRSTVLETSPTRSSVASRNISTSSVRRSVPVYSAWAFLSFDGSALNVELSAVL
jgi:hypothetical protein